MGLGVWTTLAAMALVSADGSAEDGVDQAPSRCTPDASPDAALAAPFPESPAQSQFRDSEPDTDPAAALIYAPISASSPEGGLSVTVVASRANSDNPRTVYALIARPGQFVEWTRLPIQELPEAVIVPNDDTIVCIQKNGLDETMLVTLDSRGRSTGRLPLTALLPPGALRDERTRITLAVNDIGRCLAIPMACGGIAFVDFAAPNSGDLELCSVALAPRYACGIEAWLDQARDLLRDGDVEAARFALEAAIETEPADARGYRELARFHEKAGNPEAQLRWLRQGLDMAHADADGVVDEAWRIGTPAARLALEYVEATRAVRGDAEARDALVETLALYPCMEQAVLLRAELLLAAEQEAGALASLEGALAQLDPGADVAAAYHDVGRFLKRHKRYADAIRFLEDAYALGETSEFVIRGIADLHLANGDPANAAEWLSRLADHWRRASNGDSELERRLRGYQRLAELEKEIEGLWTLAAATTTR